MDRKPRMFRWTALVMGIWWTLLNVAPAGAGLAPSRLSGTTSITCARDADMIAIQRGLEHKVVAQKLRDYGVTPEQVQLRLATASDEDVHTLATATKGLPAGGDALGVLVTILIIVLLVIVIMKLLNKDITVK